MAWAFHWRAPLQTKGFLKIIEFILAMLVFSLIAGFDLNGYIKCDEGTNLPNSSYRVAYPYSNYRNTTGGGSISNPFNDGRATSGAQFAVTWGVFTCFYCLAALAVYVVFTANENMEKLVDTLVYVDLGCHLAWVVGWFIVSVEWVVSSISITHTFSNYLVDLATEVGEVGDQCRTSQDTKVQADIASLLSFLCMFVWGANVYWVFIDTVIFIKWQARRRANLDNF